MKGSSQTRTRLLQTATELLWAQSYGGVSVDSICVRAGVNKGSFYHFFPSKSELAAQAFEEHWQQSRPMLDRIFSPQVAPLERLMNYCDLIYELQQAQKLKNGKVCGCPYASVASEISTSDEKLRQKSREIFQRQCRYFESALRDATSQGLIGEFDLSELAQQVFCLVTGALVRARVEDDLTFLKNLKPCIKRLLGLSDKFNYPVNS